MTARCRDCLACTRPAIPKMGIALIYLCTLDPMVGKARN